jgi:Peptidase family C25
MSSLRDVQRFYGENCFNVQPLSNNTISWSFRSPYDHEIVHDPMYSSPRCFIALPTEHFKVRITAAKYVSLNWRGEVLSRAELKDATELAEIISNRVATTTFYHLHDARILRLKLNRQSNNRNSKTAGESSRYFEAIEGEIIFEGPIKESDGIMADPEGPFERSLVPLLANYEESLNWRSRPEFASSQFDFARQHLTDSPYLKIEAEGKGPVRVTMRQLRDAGLPDAIKSGSLSLWLRSNRVEFHSSPTDPEGTFFFYSPGRTSYTTNREVFFLTWKDEDQPDAERCRVRKAPSNKPVSKFIAEEYFEQNRLFYTEMDGGYQGIWYWSDIGPGSYPFFQHRWTSPHYAAADATVELQAHFYLPYRAPTRLNAKINGHDIGYGIAQTGMHSAPPVTWRFPSQWLSEELNELHIAFDSSEPVRGKALQLDWFRIRYPQETKARENCLTLSASASTNGQGHVLKATGFSIPKVLMMAADESGRSTLRQVRTSELTNALLADPTWARDGLEWIFFPPDCTTSPVSIKLRQPLDWCKDNSQADLVMLCADEFLSQAERLANYRRGQDYRVRILARDDIFDAFNSGLPAVQPIKDALTWAMAHWKKPIPAYALLVGEPAFDWKDDFKSAVSNHMPIYNPPDFKLTNCSDQWFTYINGPDKLPDIVISRFSSESAVDVDTIIDNVIDYETKPVLGPWRIRNLTAVDDEFLRFGLDVANQEILHAMPCTILHQSRYPYVLFDSNIRSWRQRFALDARDRLVDKINRGVRMINWYGHAGPHVWSHERVFMATQQPNSDMRLLQQHGKYAFMTNMSCRSGWINLVERPFNTCLAEEVMRHRGKGAIGVLAPSGATGTSHHANLSHRLMHILHLRRNRIMGAAVTQAKIEYHLETDEWAVSNQFILLGDPLLRLALPPDDLEVQSTPKLFTEQKNGELEVTLSHAEIKEGTASLLVCYDPAQALYEQVGQTIKNGKAAFTVPVAATQALSIRIYGYFCNSRTGQESTGLCSVNANREKWNWRIATTSGEESHKLILDIPKGCDADSVNLRVNGVNLPPGQLQLALRTDNASDELQLEVVAVRDSSEVSRWQGLLIPTGEKTDSYLLLTGLHVSPDVLTPLHLRAAARAMLHNLSSELRDDIQVVWVISGNKGRNTSIKMQAGEKRELVCPIRSPYSPGDIEVELEIIVSDN